MPDATQERAAGLDCVGFGTLCLHAQRGRYFRNRPQHPAQPRGMPRTPSGGASQGAESLAQAEEQAPRASMTAFASFTASTTGGASGPPGTRKRPADTPRRSFPGELKRLRPRFGQALPPAPAALTSQHHHHGDSIDECAALLGSHQSAVPAEMGEKTAASFPNDRKECKVAVVNGSGVCIRHARGYRKWHCVGGRSLMLRLILKNTQ